MKVLGIGVEVQYTKAMEDGSYKKVCLSADAQLEDGEDRSEAHRALYAEVAEDLKSCFSNNSKKPRKRDYPENPMPNGTHTGKPRKKKGNPGKAETKMCPIHNVPMKRWTNDNGGSWYSHNDETTGGEWCSGKPKNRGKK